MPVRTIALLLVAMIQIVGTASSQTAASKHDLSRDVKTFETYANDFRAAKQNVHGVEFEGTDFLENTSQMVEERLDDLSYTLRLYDRISCKADREKVKSLVKEQSGLIAYLINYDADRVAGMLSFVKVPATAQTGLKMKDDMRAAKEKLDAIAASLK
jgi:hypothetical protein